MIKRIYIAGPMSGLPAMNYPAFNTEAARLRALGFEVENPAENPEQDSWEAYMRVAQRQMLTCGTMKALPEKLPAGVAGVWIANGIAETAQ